MRGVVGWLTVAALFLAACGSSPTPVSIVVGRVATATALATSTDVPQAAGTSPPTATITPLAASATASGLRTKTPVPAGSASPSPSATRRSGGGGAPPTPTATAPSAGGGSLDTRAHGVSGTLRMEAVEHVYRTGEQMWFRWTVTNLTQADLNYGHIGVLLSSGEFHTSWSGSFLRPRSTANWRDWVPAAAAGQQTLVLAICLSSAAECENGGKWVNLTAPLVVTVQ